MYIASLTHYWIVYCVLKDVLFLAALCYFRAHARAHVASQDIQHESQRYSFKLPFSCEILLRGGSDMHPLLYNRFYLADAHGLRGTCEACDHISPGQSLYMNQNGSQTFTKQLLFNKQL